MLGKVTMTTALVLLTTLSSMLSLAETADVKCNVTSAFGDRDIDLPQDLEKHESALLLLLGFGSLSILLALLYVGIRRYIFEDVNNVDSSFDAGGNVSTSLTAVTIAAQLLWPGDLMQSVTVAVKFGIAGCFWYCSGALINLALFPLLSFKFKTRAPGAKTYLQVILARFGRPAHSVFCFFALLVNVLILSTILVGGVAVVQSTTKDASPEFCILVLVTLCGSYSFIGGLGSTFYVSYFNALTTFVVLSYLVLSMFYLDDLPFGDLEEIYNKVNCLPDVEGNTDGSYFTFLSEGAVIFGLSSIFLVTSITYCDQASWQSRIAARPLQGALGFLLGGFIWFSVPATIGTAAGVTYLAVSATDPDSLLSEAQVNSGIVSTFMSEKALGKQGSILMLTMDLS
ncbi:urea-proton symporter DUR3 [Aplysia californica]|uniref:Urea-proton symporter DUR3 n=1 Tax=Aplysia californica TaxID=6500 RepID=A0ABM1VUY9_APLCA|nr:urea-proton symporter DUR3 [Aplysia californica]